MAIRSNDSMYVVGREQLERSYRDGRIMERNVQPIGVNSEGIGVQVSGYRPIGDFRNVSRPVADVNIPRVNISEMFANRPDIIRTSRPGIADVTGQTLTSRESLALKSPHSFSPGERRALVEGVRERENRYLEQQRAQVESPEEKMVRLLGQKAAGNVLAAKERSTGAVTSRQMEIDAKKQIAGMTLQSKRDLLVASQQFDAAQNQQDRDAALGNILAQAGVDKEQDVFKAQAKLQELAFAAMATQNREQALAFDKARYELIIRQQEAANKSAISQFKPVEEAPALEPPIRNGLPVAVNPVNPQAATIPVSATSTLPVANNQDLNRDGKVSLEESKYNILSEALKNDKDPDTGLSLTPIERDRAKVKLQFLKEKLLKNQSTI